MEELKCNTASWFALLNCGTELNGVEKGSFDNYKTKKNVIDLWVETKQGKVFAHKENDLKPLGFAFHVHIVLEEGSNIPVEKYFKLTSIYPNVEIVKHVNLDGSSRLTRIAR